MHALFCYDTLSDSSPVASVTRVELPNARKTPRGIPMVLCVISSVRDCGRVRYFM